MKREDKIKAVEGIIKQYRTADGNIYCASKIAEEIVDSIGIDEGMINYLIHNYIEENHITQPELAKKIVITPEVIKIGGKDE